MNILSITIEGFGSIRGPFSYTWASPGINIIRGKNGSGKTTLISALPWVIFGETLKGSVAPWRIEKDYKGTKVEIDLKIGSDDVKIIRCREYSGKINGIVGGNRIFLHINGVYQKELRDKKDTQKRINELVGVSFRLFKNSILFGQKLIRLLQEGGSKQKELFDEAFNTEFINQAKKKAGDDLAVLNSTYDKQDNVLQVLKAKKETIEANLKNARTNKINWENNHATQIRTLQGNIKKAEDEITELAHKEAYASKSKLPYLLERKKLFQLKADKGKKASDQVFRLDMAITATEAEAAACKNELKKLITTSSTSKLCSYCNQPLDAEHKKIHDSKVKEERGRLNLKLQSLDAHRNLTRKALNEESLRVNKYIKYIVRLEKIEAEIDTIRDVEQDTSMLKSKKLWLNQLLKSLDDTRSEVKPKFGIAKFKQELEKAELVISIQEAELVKMVKQKRNQEWVINFALSNKGLKAYIFNSLLYKINQELARFKHIIGFSIEFAIDLESGNKNFEARITKGEIPIDYNDLSGGEQQLVDICLAFSINASIPSAKKFNVLILDEAFESLDPENTELITDILVEKAKTKSLHIITHNFNFTAPSTNRITHLKRVQGYTRSV